MYRTWTASGSDAQSVARELEAHLNEYADSVVSISYAVDGEHHVLVVYTPIEMTAITEESAVAVAEHIIDASPP